MLDLANLNDAIAYLQGATDVAQEVGDPNPLLRAMAEILHAHGKQVTDCPNGRCPGLDVSGLLFSIDEVGLGC